MREIKFRAWHLGMQGKYEMIYDVAVWQGHLWYIGFCHKEPIIEGFDKKAIIMAYTGLKDKNGKEIYEGDIIRYLYSRKLIKGEIAWGCFGFWIKGHGERELFYIEARQVEVIGTIYENPELLEED